MSVGRSATTQRNLSYAGLGALVVIYVAIIQIGGLLLAGGSIDAEDSFVSASNLIRLAIIPVAVSSLFAIAVATWLGWWREILVEPHPAARWVRIVPVAMVVAAVLAIDWPNLFGVDPGLVAALVVLVILVGFTEELMFRGISVVGLRRHGLSEAKVALYSSALFGAVHLSNALGTGPTALAQALVVCFAGYFLYLTRRYSGMIVLAMGVHALWDFGLLSSQLGPDPAPYLPTLMPVLALIGLAILVLRRRDRIEPAEAKLETARPAGQS